MTSGSPDGAEPELVFTLASGANAFFHELAEALCFELSRLGAPARVTVGELLDVTPDRVHVLLPPHEFVVLTKFEPPRSMLRRSMLISAEQPSSPFFARDVKLARSAGAVFDINPRGVRAYREQGIDAAHLQLGYTEAWDGHGLAPERDIDVLFLGRDTDRRAAALSSYADVLERFTTHFVISDNSRPNASSGPSFVSGEDKLRLLARSKVLLNIHGDDEPYFEWLRVAEAICSGCVVVSEHSTDIEPLRAGEHLITGRLETLGLLAAAVAEDEQLRARVGNAGRELLRTQAPLSGVAEQLRVAARRIAANPVDPEAVHAARVGGLRLRVAEPKPKRTQPPVPGFTGGEMLALRAIKQQLQQLAAIRRQLAAQALAWQRPQDPLPRTVRVDVSRAWSTGPPPSVTVIVPLYNHPDEVAVALDSVVRSDRQDWELIVVDDGSTDGSGAVVSDWIGAHPHQRCLLLRHEVNRGLPSARNTGAEFARSELLVMLDADNALRPAALSLLADALERDPSASFSYGILDRFSSEGPDGLLSQFGWDPERLRRSNYIDALAMIRRSVLEGAGGYTTDSRLMGWEDYDLWVRLAEAGHHGVLVPQMLASYRVGHTSMISVTNLSVTDAFAAIVDHAPKLMAGLEIPGL